MNKLYLFNGPRMTKDEINAIKLEAFDTINDDDLILSGYFEEDEYQLLQDLEDDKENGVNVKFAGYDHEAHNVVYNNLTIDSVIEDLNTRMFMYEDENDDDEE